ncbi:hypothetical protein [Microbacterium sp. H6]|uniref:hypothetical protein n=1 Tax=Microbacterium sp. H6 TaxID=421122 RepID=UPI000DE52ECB|nr:hypothetical protein [Microbacterium sp. H6]RBO73050.1 hypothetical protein DSP71_07350 [Microbacterium sp. H6]
MDSQVRYIFQQQVADQCELALLGIRMMNAGLDARAPNRDELWHGIQVFVTAAGNVSKALWGAGGRRAGERAELRASLAVSDESALKGFTFRNHFEHFDDRISTWAKDDNRGNYLDRHIGAPESVLGPESTERFRVYDPQTGIVYFWGDQIEVGPVAAELTRLHGVAKHALLQPPSWPDES